MSKSSAAKPARLEVLVENIPERIRKLRRGVVWSWRRRQDKWGKLPLQRTSAPNRTPTAEIRNTNHHQRF